MSFCVVWFDVVWFDVVLCCAVLHNDMQHCYVLLSSLMLCCVCGLRFPMTNFNIVRLSGACISFQCPQVELWYWCPGNNHSDSFQVHNMGIVCAKTCYNRKCLQWISKVSPSVNHSNPHQLCHAHLFESAILQTCAWFNVRGSVISPTLISLLLTISDSYSSFVLLIYHGDADHSSKC